MGTRGEGRTFAAGTVASGRMCQDVIDEISERMAFIRDRGDDRIGVAWALKMIAEGICRLDEADRLEGFLPVQVRPPMMLNWNEAATALHALREYWGLKGGCIGSTTVELMEKLDGFFEGRE